MVIAMKHDLVKAVLILKAHDQLNAAYVLEDAINEHEFDADHHEFRLQVVNVPNQLECAERDCCTTKCIRFASGTCEFHGKDKYKCYMIRKWIND